MLMIISGCNYFSSTFSKPEIINDTPIDIGFMTQDEKLLNGQWKFKTFLGDGSNYRDIKPTAEDTIIDNSDLDLVEFSGNWQTKKLGQRDSSFWGHDFLAFSYSKLNPDIKVKFNYPKIALGYYEHFVFYPFASSLNTKVTVKHAGGETSQYFNQRNRTGQWLSLGIFNIADLAESSIEFSTIHKGQVAVDAIMLRPINESVYLKAQQEKQQAYKVNLADESWQKLAVPGHWGMLNEYATYTGKGWYRKEFTLPDNWQATTEQRYRLTFDGVYHVAKVYLNGQFLGVHKGGFTPFEFDVTDKLDFTRDNVLAVEADNNAIVGATWNWGGIIRDVKLIKNNDARITFQYIHAEPDLIAGDASLSLKVRVENFASRTRVFKFSAKVNRNGLLASFDHELQLDANSVSEFNLESNLTAKQVSLWHFDRPNLYELTSELSEQGKLLHQRQDRFGIRKVEITDSQFLLNGEPIRVGGFNRISDHRYWGTSEPDELLASDIKMMKNAGANFMRIMHGTQHKRLLELCDEVGMLIFEEANIRELTNPEFVAPEYALNKQWLREMIERDINHPSIIGWSIGNELKEHYQYVTSVKNYVKKELDPYRLVTNVSNTGYRKGDSAENDPLGLSDLLMQNIYQKDPESVISTIKHRWPNRPVFISEYGLGRFDTASLDNDYANFSEWHEMIRGRNTHVVGSAIWSFNDYRSGYAQSLEDENRAWGLVNTWRQKRRAYKTVQQELSPIKLLQIDQVNINSQHAKVSVAVRDVDDYPSYTIKNYQLEWQLNAENGDVLSKASLALPTLKPGDQTWQTGIDWSGDIDNPYSLTVRIISSNGYVRFEKELAFLKPLTPTINSVLVADNAVRVEFEKQTPSVEYFVRYRRTDGEIIESEKTINNSIELTNLDSRYQYTLELLASNDVSNSAPSKPFNVTLSGKALSPSIYETMIDKDKFIVGFSGKVDDIGYILQYGYAKGGLNMKVTTSSRGMITADIDPTQKTLYYQLKSKTLDTESQWSKLDEISL
ncbi:beta galactosidase jelly roll domain-containing protein [Shewanella electrodiphila]|uniref:Beta galactosidase jelly roll domain-containing protein n=1 Tax=Shewanella electrodiphila TaxID=934143 RepID=A0ABT0KMG4_9GAMM|nr:glycoside hydrolase family 2 TIM barrel-domain containing protein [Shewanella electrodiphila]MCL1045040.1 beta galactosidase jelly roll domain-containing protein [Shewanella electrodiphila]